MIMHYNVPMVPNQSGEAIGRAGDESDEISKTDVSWGSDSLQPETDAGFQHLRRAEASSNGTFVATLIFAKEFVEQLILL